MATSAVSIIEKAFQTKLDELETGLGQSRYIYLITGIKISDSLLIDTLINDNWDHYINLRAGTLKKIGITLVENERTLYIGELVASFYIGELGAVSPPPNYNNITQEVVFPDKEKVRQMLFSYEPKLLELGDIRNWIVEA